MNRQYHQSAMRGAILLFGILCAGGCGGVRDAEYLAAEWVLETGGQVTIEIAGKQMEIPASGRLPSKAFALSSVAWDVYPGDRNDQVSDADLQRFATLTRLKQLDLWAAKITDAGVDTLLRIETLERLQLSETQITDNGLGKLQGLASLRELGLVGTPVTDGAVRRFQRARPDVKLVIDRPKGK